MIVQVEALLSTEAGERAVRMQQISKDTQARYQKLLNQRRKRFDVLRVSSPIAKSLKASPVTSPAAVLSPLAKRDAVSPRLAAVANHSGVSEMEFIKKRQIQNQSSGIAAACQSPLARPPLSASVAQHLQSQSSSSKMVVSSLQRSNSVRTTAVLTAFEKAALHKAKKSKINTALSSGLNRIELVDETIPATPTTTAAIPTQSDQ
mmetsp:Transcript_9874/g.20750  ORF Transcript_9874/g.20750 Transcript_9874/m.20750 type:complete len:205 (+) Transcript_9874:33-647(+)